MTREDQRAALIDSVVPKELRGLAHRLVREMPAGTVQERERRRAADIFVSNRRRNRKELIRFVKQMGGTYEEFGVEQ